MPCNPVKTSVVEPHKVKIFSNIVGGTQCLEVVLTRTLESLAIMKGRTKSPPPLPLKGGPRKLSWWEGGGAQKLSDPQFSHFVGPPPGP